MDDLKKLRDERNTLFSANKAIYDDALKAGKLGAEGETKFNANESRIAEIDKVLVQAEKFAGKHFEKQGKDAPGFDPSQVASEDAKKEFASFLRDPTNKAEFATITAAGNTALVPVGIMPPIEIRRLNNKIRQAMAEGGYNVLYNPNTQAVTLPKFDDTGNVAAAIAETANHAEVSPTIATVHGLDDGTTLNAKLYTSKQEWYSNTLIMAGGFDITSYVIPRHYRRLDRVQESAWMTALKAATVGLQTADAAALTYPEYITWVGEQPAEYRDDSVIFVSTYGYTLLRLVRDDNNRPILDTNPANGVMYLDGKRVYITGSLDGAGNDKIVGIVASLDCLKPYDAGPDRVKVYVDNPNDGKLDSQGYEIFKNGDFGFVGNGIRTLKTKSAA